MPIQSAPWFISETGPRPDLPQLRFKDHNVEVAAVLDAYRMGMTSQQLAAWFDTLDISIIQEAIDYYHRYRSDLDDYLNHLQAYAAEQQRKTPLHPSIARVRRAMQQRQQQVNEH